MGNPLFVGFLIFDAVGACVYVPHPNAVVEIVLNGEERKEGRGGN
jgi:hypothetical protein